MNLQPILKGDTLELRPLEVNNFEALFAAASDPLIWEQHPEPTRFRRDVFEKFFSSAIASRGAFAIWECSTEKIIGSSRYYDYSESKKEITVGYTFIERRFWGTGTNRELKTLMLDHAFQLVDSVLFDVGEANIRSRRAVEKLGAVVIKREAHLASDGSSYNRITYQLMKGAKY